LLATTTARVVSDLPRVRVNIVASPITLPGFLHIVFAASQAIIGGIIAAPTRLWL
jgi:hypothetical protein